MAQLVERFVANVSVSKTQEGSTLGWGMFLQSHPKETYADAVAYIEKQSEHPDFHEGRVDKLFLKEADIQKRLSEREDSAFDEDGEAIDLGTLSEIASEDFQNEEDETRG